MSVLDLLLIAVLIYAAFRGFRQGALSQLAAFGGAVVGLGVGAMVAPPIAGAIIDGPSSTLALLTLGFLLLAIILFQGFGMAIGMRLRAAAAGVGAAPVDRTAGIVVGVGGLIVAVWLLSAALAHGPSPFIAQQLRDSWVASRIDETMPPAPNVVARVGNYLDDQGFPQVFHGTGRTTAPPVDPPSDAAVAAAQAAAQDSTVQVRATGCGGISSGSGFVTTSSGFVVTNAHVVAGARGVSVRDPRGTHEAVPIHFDAELDLAVLASPETEAPAVAWTDAPATRGVEGATLGFPGGQREMEISPATVRDRSEARGRDIYGREVVSREVLTLTGNVRRGDSGGPFVTSTGRVGGVVFAAAPDEPSTGYALTAEGVRPHIQAALARNEPVDTGECRF